MARQPLDLTDLLRVVEQPESAPDLQRYYVTRGGGPPAFTGGRFELLGGGGDRPEVASQVTAEDLVAVELLSVQVPPRVALDLLEGPLGHEVAALLEQIDPEVALGTPEAASMIADGGPAQRAWHLLEEQTDVGWVTAGKLLARKRPKLIPVYDSVVKCALGAPRSVWRHLHAVFAAEDGALPRRLKRFREDAGVPAAVTPLRVLDVVLWMRHRQEHRSVNCPGLL